MQLVPRPTLAPCSDPSGMCISSCPRSVHSAPSATTRVVVPGSPKKSWSSIGCLCSPTSSGPGAWTEPIASRGTVPPGTMKRLVLLALLKDCWYTGHSEYRAKKGSARPASSRRSSASSSRLSSSTHSGPAAPAPAAQVSTTSV